MHGHKFHRSGPTLLQQLFRLAEEQHAGADANEDWASRVRRALRGHAAPRLVSADALAEQLGVSARAVDRLASLTPHTARAFARFGAYAACFDKRVAGVIEVLQPEPADGLESVLGMSWEDLDDLESAVLVRPDHGAFVDPDSGRSKCARRRR